MTNRSEMLARRTLFGALALAACSSPTGTDSANSVPTQVDRPPPVASAPATPEPAPLPPRELTGALRIKAIRLASTVAAPSDYDLDPAIVSHALEGHRAEIVDCFQGRPLTSARGDAAASLWMISRVATSGGPEFVRTIRTNAPIASSDCVQHVVEKISFGTSDAPVALGVWIDVSPTSRDSPPAVPSGGLSAPVPSGSGGGSAPPESTGPKHSHPPRVRASPSTVTGRLPPEVIQRIVRQHFGALRLCYENGLRDNPDLEGTLTTGFTIMPDGSVSNVHADSSTLADDKVVACMLHVFTSISFPQPEGGIVSVKFPIQFTPGDVKPDPKALPTKRTIHGLEFEQLDGSALVAAMTGGPLVGALVQADPKAAVPFVVFVEHERQSFAIIRVADSVPSERHVSFESHDLRLIVMGSEPSAESALAVTLFDK